MVVGYERTFNGRAAGMRTYALVCMASTALTIFVGFAPLWYGGHAHGHVHADPTRVVQGVVTGIGFLGAGVIVKDGLTISGLTTAASIWAASAVGVLLGVGFYACSLVAGLLCMLSMTMVHRLERTLPGRSTLDVTLTFRRPTLPAFEELAGTAQMHGYRGASRQLQFHLCRQPPGLAVLRGGARPLPRHLARALAQELATPTAAAISCASAAGNVARERSRATTLNRQMGRLSAKMMLRLFRSTR